MVNVRTAVMHDDLGIITGPDGHAYIETVSELIAAIDLQPGKSVAVFVNGEVTHDVGEVTIPARAWLIFSGTGSFAVSAGAAVTIEGCVLAAGHLAIFTGSGAVSIESQDCIKSHRWWGNSGGWFISNLYGDLEVHGDVVAERLFAEKGWISGCEMMTVCGSGIYGLTNGAMLGEMTGPLILARDPILDMEAVPRQWVVDYITGVGAFQIDNVCRYVFEGADQNIVVFEAEGTCDELKITFTDLCVTNAILDDLLADSDASAPPDPNDWFTSGPYVTEWGIPGINVGACP